MQGCLHRIYLFILTGKGSVICTKQFQVSSQKKSLLKQATSVPIIITKQLQMCDVILKKNHNILLKINQYLKLKKEIKIKIYLKINIIFYVEQSYC